MNAKKGRKLLSDSGPKKPYQPRNRYICWTLNNPTESEIANLQSLVLDPPQTFTYVLYGKEVGENGTPHLQGYLECSKAGILLTCTRDNTIEEGTSHHLLINNLSTYYKTIPSLKHPSWFFRLDD